MEDTAIVINIARREGKTFVVTRLRDRSIHSHAKSIGPRESFKTGKAYVEAIKALAMLQLNQVINEIKSDLS